MTLDKAIEIQRLISITPPSGANQDFIDAIKLGIEAMKRIQECRLTDHLITEDYLPGETEDLIYERHNLILDCAHGH